jgi:hypothetical protein
MASVPADVIPLPSALQCALASFPEDVAARADATLRVFLHERLTALDSRQWTSSTLTGDGFPVELTFTTADDRLRYTVEPLSWQESPQQRLETAILLVNWLAASTVPEDIATAWRAAQRCDTLRYGAWLGGRHGTDPHEDEYKLYVEWPQTGVAEEGPVRMYRPRLSDRVVTLRMVAFSPTTQQHEAYYRVPSLAPYHLPRVLEPCGMESRSQDVLDLLTDAYGHAIRERIPGASVGVSYTMTAGGEPLSVSLFLFARVFWGADGRIRERFGQCARALGWDDSRYQRVTAALASHQTWTTQHGILGLTLTRTGQFHLSIGVRPPELVAPRDDAQVES